MIQDLIPSATTWFSRYSTHTINQAHPVPLRTQRRRRLQNARHNKSDGTQVIQIRAQTNKDIARPDPYTRGSHQFGVNPLLAEILRSFSLSVGAGLAFAVGLELGVEDRREPISRFWAAGREKLVGDGYGDSLVSLVL